MARKDFETGLAAMERLGIDAIMDRHELDEGFREGIVRHSEGTKEKTLK